MQKCQSTLFPQNQFPPACKGLELVGSEVLEHGGVLERGVLPLHGGQLLRGGQLDGGLEWVALLPGWT